MVFFNLLLTSKKFLKSFFSIVLLYLLQLLLLFIILQIKKPKENNVTISSCNKESQSISCKKESNFSVTYW